MATSSTDAFNTQVGGNIPIFNNYPVVSVTTGVNFWPGDVASASTSPASENNNWDVDEEEAIKRKIYELKRQFHNGRYLIVRHLPRDATEEVNDHEGKVTRGGWVQRLKGGGVFQEVRELLHGYLVHSVQLQPCSGSARVLLAEPEVLETWARNTTYSLRGHKVTIVPSATEGLLCVARLPFEFSEEDFTALVASLGEVSYSFLMCSEKTGESKCYGFVEYTNKEVALQAKALLEGREIRDTQLVCDWIDPSHVTFASLHSTCLYVDRLPKDYRDMGEFRRIFSKVVNPPYCQIAMKNGALQDWGLVEFMNPEDAEETQSHINNYRLKGSSIRVQYCIPGVRAINIYMKLLNDPGPKRRGALLPEPPANTVFTQLQNLAKQNPAFASSLQNIILTQIQTLQSGLCTDTGTMGPSHAQLQEAPPQLHGGPPPIRGGAPVQMHGPPPPPPQNSHAPCPPMRPPMRAPPPPPPPTSMSLNSNAQAALVILLAAQLQTQQQNHKFNISREDGNNLLSSPHIMSLLQSLVKQGDPQSQQPQQQPQQQQQQQPSTTEVPHPNGFSMGTGVRPVKTNYQNGFHNNFANKQPMKTPLLPTPNKKNGSTSGVSADGNTWDEAPAHPPPGSQDPLSPLLSGVLGQVPGLSKSGKEDLTSTISTLLSNAHSLQQLLGSLQDECPTVAPAPPAPPVVTAPPMQTAPPQMPHQAPPVVSCAQVVTRVPHPPPQASLFHPAPPSNALMSMLLQAAGQQAKPALLGDAPPRPQPFMPHLVPVTFEQPPPPVSVSSAPTYVFGTPVSSRVTPSWSPPPILQTAAVIPSAPPIHPQSPRLFSPVYLTPAKGMAPAPHPGFSTPIGQKRKSSHILPSPEPSPENGYVGQHSQGLGGHYADSYIIKKLRKN
ncbi:uncharacterized protein LOC143041033 [Oratosquilla oratoria]|uniref:uncharacterized protein LOC143041033 n=1 Tax=Oratosquilla oratoria TaxID=337810 RepID=UPI003F76A8D5